MTYENLDARLINSLLGNGRASLRSLGEELDVSVTTVSNHLQDLEEQGVIEGYSPDVNYHELAYDVTAVLQLKVEGAALPEITVAAASMANNNPAEVGAAKRLARSDSFQACQAFQASGGNITKTK